MGYICSLCGETALSTAHVCKSATTKYSGSAVESSSWCPGCSQLKAEVAWLKSGLIDLESAESAVDDLMRSNDKLKEDVAHWKGNHADQVKRNRLFIERPDMPVERVQAYDTLVKSEKQNKVLREGINTAILCIVDHQPNRARMNLEQALKDVV